MSRYGVGIVGANWAARGHLPAWRVLASRVEPLAICTTRMETAAPAAERLGLPRAYAGIGDLIADPDIDIVSLGGPPPARFEMAIAALEAGKHVFTCVPFAMNERQANQLAACAAENARVGVVDAYFCWTPGLSYFRELVRDGFLGELFAVNVDFSMGQFVDMSSNYPYRWTGYASNGTGVLPNSCSHVFHTLTEIFGPVRELCCDAEISKKVWNFPNGEMQIPEVADTANIFGRLENGSMFNIHAGRAVPSGEGFRLTAYGSKRRLVAESPAYPLDNTVRLTVGHSAPVLQQHTEDLPIPAKFFSVPGENASIAEDATATISLARLYANMLDAIENKGKARPDFKRAAEIQKIVEVAERSRRNKQWENVARSRYDN